MKKAASLREKLFMASVKQLPCAICAKSPISECHHITDTGRRLGNMFCLPLCTECHRGANGFSGTNRRAWDKSLKNQLLLLHRVCRMLGISMPHYQSKIVPRRIK